MNISLETNTFWQHTYTELLALQAPKHEKKGNLHTQLVLWVLLPLLRSVLSCGQQTTRSSFQAMALHRISSFYGSIQQ